MRSLIPDPAFCPLFSISRLRIDGATKCSPTARGFVFGSGMGFVAEVKPKAGFGWTARVAFLCA
jgi:hypothetical protein